MQVMSRRLLSALERINFLGCIYKKVDSLCNMTRQLKHVDMFYALIHTRSCLGIICYRILIYFGVPLGILGMEGIDYHC